MARITYGDKSTAQVSPLPEDQKWVSADANEVKESVNALYDINGVLVGVAGAVVDIGEGEVGQVLISSGVGAPPAWLNSGELPVTPFFSLTSGSQSGIYVEDGANSGRAKFSLVGGNPALDLAAWSGSSWNVTVGGVVAYQSSDDVADPTLCTAWTIAGGVAPLPDTSVLYGPVVQETLQQLAERGTEVLTGNTLWVDAVNGDDATGVSGRQDRPFLTIQSAISQASSPSTVRIRPGSYQGPIVLKNGVDIECDLGVSITAEINVINTYTISDGGVAVVCSITGKPRVFLIEGSAPPAGACLHLSNSGSSIFVDIESLVGDTSDTDIGIFLEGGRITGSIGSITTTTYDGIWMSAQNCSVNLEIGSISAGDNPIEVTACSASEIRAGHLSGNGINIVAGNGKDVDVCIVSQRCVMFGQSILSTVNGGSVKAFLSLGQYDAGGGIGFRGLCEGAIISGTRIFNATVPIELAGDVGYQFDGGLVLGCVLVGSGDSIGASTSVSVVSRGSSANTAVGTSVTVEGDLFYNQGGPTVGQVPTANTDGSWSWA